MRNDLVLVRGGGRIGTAVAHRLRLCGLPVVVTEAARPTLIHRLAAFGAVVYESDITVEGVPARRAANPEGLRQILENGVIPVLVDPAAVIKEVLMPWVLVDATGLDRNVGTRLSDAPIVVGVGPGFTAGRDVHAVVESRLGQDLGRMRVEGELESPPRPAPFDVARAGLVRAETAGRFQSRVRLGQIVRGGDLLGEVDGGAVAAPQDGLVTGLLMDGLFVGRGMRLAEVDSRRDPGLISAIDPGARAVAGGVIEAILYTAAVGGLPGQALSPGSGPEPPGVGE